jgi:hypothetical protein
LITITFSGGFESGFDNGEGSTDIRFAAHADTIAVAVAITTATRDPTYRAMAAAATAPIAETFKIIPVIFWQ